MAAALRHRGPDDSDVWVDPSSRVMLANARLAVRDTSPSGRQPVQSPDGRVVMTYNGELYRRRGEQGTQWPPRSQADTEQFLQVLHGARDISAALRDTDAMFALAWIDQASGVVRLARDHFGIKPLVYAVLPDCVVFASEPTALFASGLVEPGVDPLTFVRKAYVRMDAADDETWFRGIRCVPPASMLTLDGGDIRTETFWEPRLRDADVTPDEVTAAFANAVAIRRPADRTKAALLSGGFDSTAVFTALVRAGDDVEAYAVHFEGGSPEQNVDLPYAREVARDLDRPLHVCEIRPADLSHVDVALDHINRPMLHGADIGMFMTYRAIAEAGATVTFSGHGSDEMWGYQDGRYFPIVAPDFAPEQHSEYYLKNHLHRNERPCWHAMIDLIAAAAGVDTGDVTDAVWETTFAPYRSLHTIDAHKRGRYHLVRRFLLYVNEMVDATSAAFGLEDRPPFQDVTLTELAFGMPEYVKNHAGPTTVKPFLKEALRSYVPDAVLNRPKRGFPTPVDAAFAAALRDRLADSAPLFDLSWERLDLEALGVGELLFLWSSCRWFALGAARPVVEVRR